MRTAEVPLKNDLIATINEFVNENSISRNLHWWRSEINIIKEMENSSNSYEKLLATNTLDYICSFVYEKGKEYMIRGKVDMAIKIYSLGTIIFPESKYFYEQLFIMRSSVDNY